MRRFRVVATFELEASDWHSAFKRVDRLQQLLDDQGAQLAVERIEGISADVVPIDAARDGGTRA